MRSLIVALICTLAAIVATSALAGANKIALGDRDAADLRQATVSKQLLRDALAEPRLEELAKRPEMEGDRKSRVKLGGGPKMPKGGNPKVPEPGTAALLGVGVALIGASRRRSS